MIKIEIDESSFNFFFEAAENKCKELATNVITRLGNDMVENARSTTKFKHGDKFNQGIQFTLISENEGEVTSKVYNRKGTEYSNFMQFGNLPVENKKMTFKIDGKWITTYKRKAISNEHLGFFSDAKEKTSENVSEIFQDEWSKLFE